MTLCFWKWFCLQESQLYWPWPFWALKQGRTYQRYKHTVTLFEVQGHLYLYLMAPQVTYPTALDYFVFISFAYIFSTVVQVIPFFFGLFVHISNQRNNKSQQLKLETFSNNLKRNHPSVWAGASLHQAGQWGILSGRTGAWGNWIGTGYLPSTTWYYEGSVNKEISKMTGKPFSTLIPPRCVQGDSEGWAKEEEERHLPPW